MCEWKVNKKEKIQCRKRIRSWFFCNGGMAFDVFLTFGGIPEKWTQPFIGLKDVNLFYLIP